MPERPEPITPASLRQWPLPEAGSSKHQRGDVLIIGGARRTPGAAVLAGLGALRVGAGRITLGIAESVAPAVAAVFPEAGVMGLPETASGAVRGAGVTALARDISGASCVVAGPGLDDPDEAAILLRELVDLLEDETPVLLDAYALGTLAGETRVRERLSGRLLLTPNVTEAGFLLGRDPGELEDDAAEIADRYGAVVSLMQMVAEPGGRRWEVTTGHSGLATSGSGDVLAGAMAGLRARGADSAQAACWAGYLHSAAGDRLSARIGPLGFLARELLDELPPLLTELG
ncbi:MAG: carbohydrate kinase, YjeF related protein [Naasia sp.]|jgi:ADP-dependent NAD(P)H-hydrate dehydratase|uniref:NAD(P)H-hydrate dehydratase n=1 Tax=Naasia sp. TaxID=2546198 RepID=UPI002626BED8|nr:NAD(P)H-hydrate dehydratase [Naasia sp.]MCU1569780.1 carbohydrate kinase, YjeF related protein [Naasia sp.]